MRLFDGLGRTDHRDVLRALGRRYDRHGRRNPRLVECEESIIFQHIGAGGGRAFTTRRHSDQDVRELPRDAYGHHGRPTTAADAATA